MEPKLSYSVCHHVNTNKGIRFLTWVVAPLSVIYSLKPHIPTHLKSLQRPDWDNLSHLGPKFKKIIEAVTVLENVLLSHIYVLILIIYFCLKLQIWPVLFWHMVLSGHVESSSPETSCDSQRVLWAHSGAFTAQSSTKQLLIFPFFSFPSPSICLHRLWLQRPFGNGIGRDSVRPNHGFIPVQPQLVSRALKTQLLWKRMDTSRGLQQRVDPGSMLVLPWGLLLVVAVAEKIF